MISTMENTDTYYRFRVSEWNQHIKLLASSQIVIVELYGLQDIGIWPRNQGAKGNHEQQIQFWEHFWPKKRDEHWKTQHICDEVVPESLFWVNYHISLTWILRPFGDDFPYKNHDSRLRENRVRSWWNLPRSYLSSDSTSDMAWEWLYIIMAW